MGAAGRRGTSESNSMHTGGETWNEQDSGLPLDAMTGEFGEPVGDIEVVAVEMSALPVAGLSETELGEPQPAGRWFRWWYIPAVLVPAAAGVTTALWLVNRRRKPAVARAYDSLADTVWGWWDDLTGGDMTKRAKKTAKKTVRRGVKSAKRQTNGLTGKATGMLAGMGAASFAGKAGDTVRDALDDASDAARDALDRVKASWERKAPSTHAPRQRAKSATTSATNMASDLWQTLSGRAAGVSVKRPAASAARGASAKGTRKVTSNTWPVVSAFQKAGNTTGSAVQQVGNSVSSTVRAARAFSFGMLVSAVATYIGMWRRNAGQPVQRETASGRMLPGYWPKFGGRDQQPARENTTARR
ncbi:MAG: hypothetical protein ACHQ4H_15090 [Ktedonobacterales bacterium]